MEENKSVKKPKSKKKIVLIVVAALFVVVIGGSVVAGAVAGAKGAPVSVIEASTTDISQDIEITGAVESEHVETVFAQVNGTISEVFVKDGATVKPGDKLVNYDVEAIENEIKKIELDSLATTYGAEASIITINDGQAKAAKAATDYTTAHAYVEHYTNVVNQLSGRLVEANVVSNELQKKQAEAAGLKEDIFNNPNSPKKQAKLKKLEKEISKLSKEYDSYDVIHLQASLETAQGDLSEYKAMESEYKAVKEAADPAAGKQKAQQSVVKEAAGLSVEDAKKELEKAKEGVNAQYQAIVSEVQVTGGQTVTAGTPLFNLSDEKQIGVRFEVTKQNMADVAEGQSATVTINGKEYEGVVSSIQKVAKTNASGATVVDAMVHIENPDDSIYLGIEANIKIHVADKKDVLMLPYNCVNYATDSTYCYVVKNGVVEKRDIEVGIAAQEGVEVLSGVSKDEQVITDSMIELSEGMKVNPTVEDKE